MYIKYFFYLISFFTVADCLSQNSEDIVRAFFEQNASMNNLTNNDIEDWIITSENVSKSSKILHIYGNQRFNEIEIDGADFGLHVINENEVVNFNTNFISGLSQKAQLTEERPTISAIEAVKSAIKQLNLTNNKSVVVVEQAEGKNLKQLISATGIAADLIPAKLMYFNRNGVSLFLAWDIYLSGLNDGGAWNLKIDASTGEILDKLNLVVECTFERESKDHLIENHTVNNHMSNKLASTNFAGGYNVYPFPIESPNHGSRSIVTHPEDPIASPFGWHDTNGSSGPEFTITRGNNAYAYDDDDNNNLPGFSPDGGAALIFDFPINTTYSSANQSEAAAITNLFYWNNITHDIWYQYGFDEASGNFQENNYGKGGTGSDSVNAEAQDGSGTCNANFATLPEGINPRMQMFVCGNRDGDLDNVVIVHEYGHGISTRLVGGPINVSSLRNQEQMGEGWSDWFGIMMTIEPGDQGTDPRPVGNWLLGRGIRTFPYSTDMAISAYTYDDIKTFSVPHGVGSVWASMLWEMTWELINEYGFDPDLYNGNGGNNIAMHLVIEALKLTPSSPGFIDGRDAILLADQVLYNGKNSCFIWNAFAKRGLGISASQGSSSSRSDGTEAFDLPDCDNDNCIDDLIVTTNVSSGQSDIQKAAITLTANNTITNGSSAKYTGGHSVMLSNGFTVSNGSIFNAKIEDCSLNVSGFSNGLVTEKIQNISNYSSKTIKSLETAVTNNSTIVYPNPTKGSIRIQNEYIIIKYSISDITGKQIIFSDKTNLNNIDIDISKHPSGIYFLEIQKEDGEIIRNKIIKN